MVVEHKNRCNSRLDLLSLIFLHIFQAAYLRLVYGLKAQVIPYLANVLYVEIKQSPVSESCAARKIDQRLNSVYRCLLLPLCSISTALLYIICARCC